MGLRRVIGNGEESSIWEDQWLDKKPAKPIRSTRRIPNHDFPLLSSLSKVSELLVQEGREWNEDLISRIFDEEDCQHIRALRPGGINSMDSFCWDYTKSGIYTVKSGYWVLTNVPFDDKPQEVTQPSLDALFQLAWKSDASPKIHHFLWKSLSNCLSVADTLKKRHIIKDGRCNRCQGDAETVNHMLFTCPFARLVWAISGVPAPPNGEMSESVYSNLHRVLTISKTHQQEEEAEKLAPWIMWRLWKNRNDLFINGVEYTAQETIDKAKEDRNEWRTKLEKRNKTDHAGGQQPTTRQRWIPPPDGWVKCNVDGSWNLSRNACGIGWVLRNNKGKILWLGARKMSMLTTTRETELEALRWAILFTSSLNYPNIIYETDSKEVIEVINNAKEWPIYTARAQDIGAMLSRLPKAKVIFQSREGNGVADRIAKETISFENYVPKVYSIVPNWLNPFVGMDEDNVTNVLGE